MNCHYCHGIDTYQQVKTRYFSSSRERSLFVENFPVSECVQCGEQILSSAAMDVLDSIHDGEGNPISFAAIPVYDHDNLAGDAQGSQSSLFANMFANVQGVWFTGAKVPFVADSIQYVIAYDYPFLKRTLNRPLSSSVVHQESITHYPLPHHAPLTPGSIRA